MIPVGEGFTIISLYLYFLFKWLSFKKALAVLGFTIFIVYLKLRNFHSHWRKLGIIGPKPNILLGNMLDARKGIHNMQRDWRKEYGKTHGVYMMGHQELCTSDPKILKEVMLSQFLNFMERVNFLPTNSGDRSNLFSNTLLFMDVHKWKTVRAQVMSALTMGRVKMMFSMFNDCAQICCSNLENMSNEQADLKAIAGRLMLDLISRAGLGANYDVQRTDDSQFLRCARKYFESGPAGDFKILLLFLFPKWAPLFQRYSGYPLFCPEENKYFTNMLTEIYEDRKRSREIGSEERKNDFFDLLLDSLQEEESESQSQPANASKKKQLTQLDIISQGFVFLLAGYDTSSTTISVLLYLVAKHPDVQQKLWEDIDEKWSGEEPIDYEKIMKMDYLDMCFKETLRMYPTFVRVSRICTSPTTIGDIPMRVGDVVSIPIREIHYDAEYWPNPEHFDPERFSRENRAAIDPLTYIPFGYGPRSCIGQRVAQFAIKVCVAHIVKRFKMDLTANSPSLPLNFKSNGPIKVLDPLYVKFVKREDL